MKKNLLIVVGIVVVTLFIASYLYWKKSKVVEAPAPTQTQNQKVAEDTTKALEKITETPKVVVPTNPINNKIPQLNPVEKTNPFNVYQNPF